MTQDLLESVEGGIATLTMNRPDSRNALSRAMMNGLAESLARLAIDPKVRLVVLTGAGRAFCSGGDVKGFAQRAAGGGDDQPGFDEKVTDLRARMEAVRWLHEMPKPTLADDAKFTTAFSKIGLSGDFGGSWFLSKLVGASRARELYFTGRVVQADEALRLGLVDRLSPYERLADDAAAWARELASLPTVAVGYMKRNLNVAQRAGLAETLDAEAIHMIRTFETDDHKGAAKAFVEKRPPTFAGR